MNFNRDFNQCMARLCAACFLLAVLLLLVGYCLKPASFPATAFGAIAAASIAASATFSASETLAQKMKYANETKLQDKRRESYIAVIEEHVSSFAGREVNKTVQNRSSAALWASSGTLAEMARFTDLVNKIDAAGKSTEIPRRSRTEFQEQLARLAIAMREDLGDGAELNVKQIASMIFDDYGRSGHSS